MHSVPLELELVHEFDFLRQERGPCAPNHDVNEATSSRLLRSLAQFTDLVKLEGGCDAGWHELVDLHLVVGHQVVEPAALSEHYFLSLGLL